MTSKSKIAATLLALIALSIAAPAANAATFDTITPATVIIAGNATYSNFTYGGITSPATVNLATSTTATTSTITFTRTSTPWSLTDGNSTISYHVEFATPITSLGLSFVASATPGLVASVGETVVDGITHNPYLPGPQVVTGIGPSVFTTTYNFATPVSSLDIIKSIDLAGSPSEGGLATITSVQNTYTIPEPTSLALLSLAALPLLRRRPSR